jgi:hypothetical protein
VLCTKGEHTSKYQHLKTIPVLLEIIVRDDIKILHSRNLKPTGITERMCQHLLRYAFIAELILNLPDVPLGHAFVPELSDRK